MAAGKRINRIKTGSFLLLLFVLFILCLGARVTGIIEHEILGLLLSVGLLLHAIRHGSWFFNFREGQWGLRRLLSTAVNWFLAAGFFFLLVTGIALSPDLFSFLGIESGMLTRQLHSGVAFWLLVLMSVHLGLHGKMLAKKMGNLLGRQWLLPLSIFTLLLGAIGFIDRMLFEKLFLGFAFDFWDPARPISLYFIFYAAVAMALTVVVDVCIASLEPKDALVPKSAKHH